MSPQNRCYDYSRERPAGQATSRGNELLIYSSVFTMHYVYTLFVNFSVHIFSSLIVILSLNYHLRHATFLLFLCTLYFICWAMNITHTKRKNFWTCMAISLSLNFSILDLTTTSQTLTQHHLLAALA